MRSREHGIRNALLTSIAPTGHDLALCGERVIRDRAGLCLCVHPQGHLQRDGTRTEEEVVDYAVKPLAREISAMRAVPCLTTS